MLGTAAVRQRRASGAGDGLSTRLLASEAGAPATLRDPRPGDMGFVVQSHGALYAAEYGFDASFEALVADIAAKYLASYDASRERCWIADIDGSPVGSVFLVRQCR